MPITRVTRISARHELLLEVGFCFQMTWFQQRQQAVQFDEIVLHGCRGEQKHVTTLQRVDELPEFCRAVSAMVGLVDNDQIPMSSGNRFWPTTGSGKRCGNQNTVMCRPEFVTAAGRCPWCDPEIEVELGREFFVPLTDQRIRDQNQHTFDQSSQQVFAKQQAGLNGFTETDFVCE